MANNLIIDPAEVVRISGNQFAVTSGEAFDAGSALARNSVDGLYYKASSSASADAQRRKFDGIALTSALTANRPALVLSPYNNAIVDIGTATGTGPGTYSDIDESEIYVVSPDLGKIMREDELASTNYVIHVGVGSDTTDNYLILNSAVPGVQVP